MPRPMTILTEEPQPGENVSPISEEHIAQGRPDRRLWAALSEDGMLAARELPAAAPRGVWIAAPLKEAPTTVTDS